MLNDLFQTYKRIIIIAVILLSTIVFWFFGCHRTAEQGEQTVSWEEKTNRKTGETWYSFANDLLSGELRLGSAGRLARGMKGRAELLIRPASSDFQGTVRITLPGHDGEGVIYQEEIMAKAGVDNIVELDIPALADPSCFFFEIFDSYDNIQISEVLQPEWAGLTVEQEEEASSDIIFLGLCSSRAEELKFLDGLTIDAEDGKALIRLILYDQENFPTRAVDLSSVSGIMIDHFNTGKFSDTQINCLREYVEKRSGCLILASGDSRKAVFDRLAGWLRIRPGGVEGKDIVFKTGSGDEKTSAMSVADFRWESPELWQSVPLADTDLVRKASLKEGCVIISAFSLTDEAFQEMTKKEEAARKLLSSLTTYVLERKTAGDMEDWAMESSLYSFLEIVHPDTAFYGVFFIIYIGSIILIAYYVLRGMEKREYIWLAVPVLAILFTVIMGIGFIRNGGRDDSSISTIRIVDTGRDDDEVCLLYQNAEGEDKDMSLGETIRLVRPLGYEYRDNVSDPENVIIAGQTLTISRRNDRLNLDIESVVPGNAWVLEMTQARQEALKKGSLFDAEITPGRDGFSGRIINTSDRDFVQAFAIRGNQYVILNDLKAGQEQPVGTGEIKCWDNNEYGENFEPEVDNSPAANVVELIRRRYFKESCGDDELVLIGITEGDKETVFRDKNREKNKLDLYVDHVILGKDPHMRYISNINRRCLREGTSMLAFDYLTQTETKSVYSFDPEKEAWSLTRNRDYFEGRIYAYNYETGKEDRILRKSGDQLAGRDLLPYLSGENQMILTFRLENKKKEGSAPVLSMQMKMKEGKE